MKQLFTLAACFVLALQVFANKEEQAKITVAKDGSGDFKTIQEAIKSCRAFQNYDKVIFIKEGIYREKLVIDSFFTSLHLIGENAENTVITYDDNASMNNIGTFNSYTLKVLGNNTILENLTIENASDRNAGQAVALHIEGDQCVITNCRILGNQDTLYAAGKGSRQYYSNCFISGTTDYIFGSATAIFDNCTIHCKKNSYITAASTPEESNYGYVFRECKLTSSDDAEKVYLGRPWRDYAHVVFIDCEMGDHIRAEGWHNWGQPNREKTAFYAEYNSSGPGANPDNRVEWSHQLTNEEASVYTVDKIFSRFSSWESKYFEDTTN